MNHRSSLLVAFLLSSVSAGIAQTLSFKVAGANRSAIVHAPSGLDRPALVLLLHGLGGNGADMQSSTQMDKVADREKFVAVYPSAVGGTWDYAGAKNDYAFFKAIIDTAVSRYGVDRERVYVTGFSQGGGEAVYAAFSYPDVFAAVAPVSSVGSGAPTPKRPVPILLTFGTKDLYTPATFMSSVASWVKIDSCKGNPVVVRPYPATNSRSVVTRITWGDCAQGTRIVVDSIQGGGHEWPNNTSTKVNNAEEVWAFFKQFTLTRTGNVGVGLRSAADRPLAAFFRSGTVFLVGADKNCRIEILNLDGRIAATVTASDGRLDLPLPSGIYMVRLADRGRSRIAGLVVP